MIKIKLTLALLLFSTIVNARSEDQCELYATNSFLTEAKDHFKILNTRFQILNTSSVAPAPDSKFWAEKLDDNTFYMNSVNKEFILSYSLTQGKYENLKYWVPIEMKYSLEDISTLSCLKLKNMVTQSRIAREATVYITNAVLQSNKLNPNQTLGESIVTLEWHYAFKKKTSYGSLGGLRKEYLSILDKVKVIQKSQRDEKFFFENWLKVNKQIFDNKLENIDYCRDSTLIIDALKNNCTNCVGQTSLFLSLFVDGGFKVPKGWVLAVQYFKDHVRPILYNEAKKETFDLVYGKTGHVQASIYPWTYYFKYLIKGTKTLIHPNELKLVQDNEVNPLYSDWFCSSSYDAGADVRLQAFNFTGIKSCGRFSPTDPGSGIIDTSVNVATRVTDETKTKVEKSDEFGGGNLNSYIEYFKENYDEDFIKTLNENQRKRVNDFITSGVGGDRVREEFSILNIINRFKINSKSSAFMGAINLKLDKNLSTEFHVSVNLKNKVILKIKNEDFYNELIEMDYALRIETLIEYIANDQYKIQNLVAGLSISNLESSLLSLSVRPQIREHLSTNPYLLSFMFTGALASDEVNKVLNIEASEVIYEKYLFFMNEVGKNPDLLLKSVLELHDKLNRRITDLNFSMDLTNFLIRHLLFNETYFFTPPREDFNQKPINLESYFQEKIYKKPMISLPKVNWGVTCPKNYNGLMNLGNSSIVLECSSVDTTDFNGSTLEFLKSRTKETDLEVVNETNSKHLMKAEHRTPVVIPEQYWGTLITNVNIERQISEQDYIFRTMVHYVQQDSIKDYIEEALGAQNMNVPTYVVNPSLHYYIPFSHLYESSRNYEQARSESLYLISSFLGNIDEFKQILNKNKKQSKYAILDSLRYSDYDYINSAFDEISLNTKPGWKILSWKEVGKNNPNSAYIDKIYDLLFVNPEASDDQLEFALTQKIENLD